MTRARIPLLVLLLTTFATSAAVQAQGRFRLLPPPPGGGGEVKITIAEGGRVEAEKDEYSVAEGDITIEYQDVKLRANKVTYNQRTRDVVAEGNVIIDQGPTRVAAERAVYNLDSKTGTFFQATGTMDPAMYFTGEKIEKVDVDTYRLTNGVFTSCELDRPAWSFHVGEAEVTVDDYAHMKDISLRAGGLPVFWSPRLTWPTKRDRSRGFLIPRVNYGSERFGARAEIGYYMPFGDSADATLYGELNSAGYYGGGLNVRYRPSENIKLGELTAYTVRNPGELAFDEDGTASARQEWRYEFEHSQENLPGGFRAVVDVQDFSNLEFFRQFDRDPRLRFESQIYSSAYLTKNRPTYSLNILADRRQFVGLNDRQTFEQLPAIQYRMFPQRVFGSPLYFSLESSAGQLRASGRPDAPEDGYFRTDIFPTLSLQVRTPSWFSVRPQLSVRETFYTKGYAPREEGSTGVTFSDDGINRFYAQGQVDFVGPSFQRVFNRQVGNFHRFKHVLEPRFRYVYTSNVTNEDRVIRFDTVDSPFLPTVRDSLEYSLTQRLIAKEGGPDSSPREVLSFSLRQAMSLSDEFAASRFSSDPQHSTGHRFQPLTAALHVNPYQSITLDAQATIGNVSRRIDQTSLSANLIGSGKNTDKYLSLTWFATFNHPIADDRPQTPVSVLGESSQVRISSGSSLLRDRLRADVQLSYDVGEGRFLEQRYLLGGTGSCYGIALEYRRFQIYVPELDQDSDYGIVITLKNVGSIATR